MSDLSSVLLSCAENLFPEKHNMKQEENDELQGWKTEHAPLCCQIIVAVMMTGNGFNGTPIRFPTLSGSDKSLIQNTKSAFLISITLYKTLYRAKKIGI